MSGPAKGCSLCDSAINLEIGMDEGTSAGIYADSFLLIMKEMNYVPPKVEILTIAVEHGFSASGGDEGGMGLPGWNII